jgi:hypothetical protein
MAYDGRHGKEDMRSFEALIVGFEDENHANIYVWSINSEREVTSTTYKPKEIKVTEEIVTKINNRDKKSDVPILEDLDGSKFEVSTKDQADELEVEEIVNLLAYRGRVTYDSNVRINHILNENEYSYCEYAKNVAESLGTSVTDDGNLSLAQALKSINTKTVVESIKTELNNLQKHQVMEYVNDSDKIKEIMNSKQYYLITF